MSHFRTIDRDTPYLLPPSVDEWLPADHLARFVVEVVDQLDLSTLTGAYRSSGGSAAYHPAMLLALLLYGYATGTYSSRRIEQASREHGDDEQSLKLRASTSLIRAKSDGLLVCEANSCHPCAVNHDIYL
jgi:hypothetical protein